MTERLSIALRARRSGGQPVRKEEILAPLGLQERVFAVTEDEPLKSARLELSMGQGPEAALQQATKWLMEQAPEAFDQLRAAGLQLDLEVISHGGGGLAVKLLPALLIACGRRELAISVIQAR
jgi:hypothetical protein